MHLDASHGQETWGSNGPKAHKLHTPPSWKGPLCVVLSHAWPFHASQETSSQFSSQSRGRRRLKHRHVPAHMKKKIHYTRALRPRRLVSAPIFFRFAFCHCHLFLLPDVQTARRPMASSATPGIKRTTPGPYRIRWLWRCRVQTLFCWSMQRFVPRVPSRLSTDRPVCAPLPAYKRHIRARIGTSVTRHGPAREPTSMCRF